MPRKTTHAACSRSEPRLNGGNAAVSKLQNMIHFTCKLEFLYPYDTTTPTQRRR